MAVGNIPAGLFEYVEYLFVGHIILVILDLRITRNSTGLAKVPSRGGVDAKRTGWVVRRYGLQHALC